MRCATLVLTLAVAAMATAADPPAAAVTGRKDGKDQSHTGGRDTVGLGLVVAAFGSAKLEYPATRERWEVARKTDHVRVQFAKPVALTAQTAADGSGKRYEVDELLVKTTPWEKRPPVPVKSPADWGKCDSVLARCGDKYFSFARCEGVLTQPLIVIFGPSPEAKD
jgi:hypothetical protein